MNATLETKKIFNSKSAPKKVNWKGFPDASLLKSIRSAGDTAIRNRTRRSKLQEMNEEVFYPVAFEVLCTLNCELDDKGKETLAAKMSDFYPNNRIVRDFLWIKEAIESGRNWNGVPVEFFSKDLGVKVIKSELKQIPLDELLSSNIPALSAVGPFFNEEERKAYFENTGSKLSLISNLAFVKFVKMSLERGLVTEGFIKLATHRWEKIRKSHEG